MPGPGFKHTKKNIQMPGRGATGLEQALTLRTRQPVCSLSRRSKRCPFFERMDAIFTSKADVEPLATADSAADETFEALTSLGQEESDVDDQTEVDQMESNDEDGDGAGEREAGGASTGPPSAARAVTPGPAATPATVSTGTTRAMAKKRRAPPTLNDGGNAKKWQGSRALQNVVAESVEKQLENAKEANAARLDLQEQACVGPAEIRIKKGPHQAIGGGHG